MTWLLVHTKKILGFEDSSNPDPFIRDSSQKSVRVKAAVGGTIILGLAIVVIAITTSALPQSAVKELPKELSVSSSPADIQYSSSLTVMVHVVGEVNNPGMYELEAYSRVIDAVMAAGGLTSNAAECAINLARTVNDGEQLTIPVLSLGCSPVSGVSAAGVLLSLNSASVEQFDSLPGIGPTLAERIVQFRDVQGGFSSVDQLNEVSGIGEKLFTGLKDLVTL